MSLELKKHYVWGVEVVECVWIKCFARRYTAVTMLNCTGAHLNSQLFGVKRQNSARVDLGKWGMESTEPMCVPGSQRQPENLWSSWSNYRINKCIIFQKSSFSIIWYYIMVPHAIWLFYTLYHYIMVVHMFNDLNRGKIQTSWALCLGHQCGDFLVAGEVAGMSILKWLDVGHRILA